MQRIETNCPRTGGRAYGGCLIPLGFPRHSEFVAGVASVANGFLAEREGGECARDGRRSQPFCYGMSEILPSVAQVV